MMHHSNGTATLPPPRRPLFVPQAIPALRLVASPRVPRRIAKALISLLVLTLLLLLFAPWQQSVRGKGQVVAYNPLERPQIVQANIEGRVHAWGEGIREGSKVKKGDVVLEIRDIDPLALERLQRQTELYDQKLQAARAMEAAYKVKLESVIAAQSLAIKAAEQEVSMAEQKRDAEKQGLLAAQAAEAQEKAYLIRRRQLLENQLASTQEVEIADRKWQEAKAKVEQAKLYLASAEESLEAKEYQLKQKQREAEGYNETARAEYQKAVGEAALAQKELTEVQGKYAKQQNQVITAPRDGTVVNLLANEIGEIVKSGDPLFTLVPEAADRAVEIWVSGNDAPLISPGRQVRLQFEGWPAVQFAGWPSVAVGTFGGEVALVDAIDNGRGQFRVLILPEKGGQWPAERYLRQGVRTNGWVLLNQVTLGYEVWRQLNGFPPVVAQNEPKDAKGDKPPKVKM